MQKKHYENYNELPINIKGQIDECEKCFKNLSSIYKNDTLIMFDVIQENENLLSYISYKKFENINIYMLYSKVKYKGYASLLLNEIKDNTILEVNTKNTNAVNLYKKNNFKVYLQKEDTLYLSRGKMIVEKCYAKVNLILNVLNKTDDNYHNVDFIMSTVDLYDTVTITKSSIDEVICESISNIRQEDNLAYKALKLFKQKYNIDTHIKIKIDKNIPIAAGLAGGSADCAGVLRGLNKFFDLNLSLEELAKLGIQLGSDVPFCIYQNDKRATNKGEILNDITIPFKDFKIVVINPMIELSTKKVYYNHEINYEKGNIEKFLNSKDFNEMISYVHNDLQNTSIKLVPNIKNIIENIKEKYNTKAIVSGSGPTVIAFCLTNQIANDINEEYKDIYFTEITKLR